MESYCNGDEERGIGGLRREGGVSENMGGGGGGETEGKWGEGEECDGEMTKEK